LKRVDNNFLKLEKFMTNKKSLLVLSVLALIPNFGNADVRCKTAAKEYFEMSIATESSLGTDYVGAIPGIPNHVISVSEVEGGMSQVGIIVGEGKAKVTAATEFGVVKPSLKAPLTLINYDVALSVVCESNGVLGRKK
jgi:hypothetical protein